jgi:hypothetical protein
MIVNAKFCPHCGVGLPQTMKGVATPLETTSVNASSGFDTSGPVLNNGRGQVPPVGQAGPTQTPSGSGGTIFALGIIIAVVIIAAAMGGGGTVRNCIGSAGGVLECSDCEKVYRSTTRNNKSQGSCIAIPGNYDYTDQCKISCK